jgi:hypothetical protein
MPVEDKKDGRRKALSEISSIAVGKDEVTLSQNVCQIGGQISGSFVIQTPVSFHSTR